MKHLLVLTSTYGIGEAPSNAKNFVTKLSEFNRAIIAKYSVIGFGSLAYPDFCKYAMEVNYTLKKHPDFTPATPLYTVHNQSFDQVENWAKEWGEKVGLSIELPATKEITKIPKQEEFTVIKKSELNQDNTFLLQLEPKKHIRFQSGDLLAFYPEQDGVARYYSIGKKERTILLSIKKHEMGVASSYLSKLQPGDVVKSIIQKNKEFHFSKKSKEVILVSNGTGIAPFLGMIEEHAPNQKVHLFWGGRRKDSFGIYESMVQKAERKQLLQTVCLAFSREREPKVYVQDLLNQQSDLVSRVLSNKGNIMICGSLGMEKGVISTLERITKNKLQTDFDKIREQIQSDCY